MIPIPGFIATPIGRALSIGAVSVVLLVGYTSWIDHRGYVRGKSKAETVFVTKTIRAEAKETVRRETVVKRVQVRTKADLKRIARQAAEISKLKQEVARGSAAHDNDVCLGPDGLRRLAAVRLD